MDNLRTVLIEEATIVFGFENNRKSRTSKLDENSKRLTTISVDKDKLKRF